MAVFITCKSDEDMIKNEVTIISTTFSKSMGHSKIGNYHANNPYHTKIELVQYFKSVPVICKFDEDPIKNKVAIIWTTFSQFYV